MIESCIHDGLAMFYLDVDRTNAEIEIWVVCSDLLGIISKALFTQLGFKHDIFSYQANVNGLGIQ